MLDYGDLENTLNIKENCGVIEKLICKLPKLLFKLNA